ncbi:Bax inhibitor-1/YccA family protein [Maridesulfovibrio ferrireducens]|uniref:Bax inhibitor-1/YccA family protein n=1 Tax=Maridesulfovibrio ferrireducens TaxID=246191 RepID=UPI001A2DD638|nr:Bax inhibitor-1/YccA family protein [Maridesulfovibrio ferrireducens]MBI9112540.1 Bax inhibitor-1/YccA family protein [Maridesulfovibrio ferrireducens]
MSRFGSAGAVRSKPEILNAFMRGVYNWMSLGLLMTAAVAWFTASTPAVLNLVFAQNAAGVYGPTMLFWVALVGEIGLVFYLSARISSLSASAATGLFMAYSGLNGLTLSVLLLAYTASSIFQTFLVTAGMFAALSLYGLTTKKDLTGMGSFMFMGLFGIIIASVVNMFMQSSAMDFVISVIGVIVFAGLTAYDSQKLKVMGESVPSGDETALRRGTIMGALTLYLDFINLFLFLLRFMGTARD